MFWCFVIPDPAIVNTGSSLHSPESRIHSPRVWFVCLCLKLYFFIIFCLITAPVDCRGGFHHEGGGILHFLQEPGGAQVQGKNCQGEKKTYSVVVVVVVDISPTSTCATANSWLAALSKMAHGVMFKSPLSSKTGYTYLSLYPLAQW